MYKALIVDDEQMIIKGLTRLIDWKSLDYEIVGTAFNGRDALEQVQTLQPDLVISDIQLGDTTGLELIEKVHLDHPSVLFIFISGYDSFSYCQKAIANGAVDYLLKPIDFNYLVEVLEKCKTITENRKILDHTDKISLQPKLGDSPKDDEKLIDSIKHYIDTYFGEEIDIASISGKFYIGQTYFSELFKKEFGINFKKYLIQVRMEKAKLYFMETNYKISDIAAKVGYDDSGYFSQVFKKYTGRTPRQFKKQLSKGDA